MNLTGGRIEKLKGINSLNATFRKNVKMKVIEYQN